MSSTAAVKRDWSRITPCLVMPAIVALTSLALALPAYVIGKREEDARHFLKNYRAANVHEAHMSYSMRYALESGEKNDVLFVGDSNGLAAIDTKQFERATGLSAYNLCSVGLLGVDGYRLLCQHYLEHHPAPRLVVFCVNPISLHLPASALGPDDIHDRLLWCYGNGDEQTRPPHPHPLPFYVKEGFYISWGKLTGGFDRYGNEPVPFRRNLSYHTLGEKVRQGRGYLEHPGVLANTERRVGHGFRADDIFGESNKSLGVDAYDYGHPTDPFPVAQFYRDGFRQLARMLQERKIPLLVRLAPVLVGQADEQYDSIHAWVLEMEEQYSNVTFSLPEVLVYEPKFLTIQFHCNAAGAKRFTTMLADEVMRVLTSIGPERDE